MQQNFVIECLLIGKAMICKGMSSSYLGFNPHDPAFMRQSCALALKAGASIMQHYRNGVAVEKKQDKSPVTQADRDAEHILEEGLRALAPDIQIIGEEAYAEKKPDYLDKAFFLLDPLDGTRDFIDKRTDFTVNIGLIDNGKAVAGVIYAPFHERLFFSGETHAFTIDVPPDATLTEQHHIKKLRVAPVAAGGLRVLASRSHLAKETEALIARLNVRETISAASSYKFCLVADGSADLYPRHGRTMEWDTAAGQAILQSAGGIVTLENGTPLGYGKLEDGLANPSFIAAGAANWQDV